MGLQSSSLQKHHLDKKKGDAETRRHACKVTGTRGSVQSKLGNRGVYALLKSQKTQTSESSHTDQTSEVQGVKNLFDECFSSSQKGVPFQTDMSRAFGTNFSNIESAMGEHIRLRKLGASALTDGNKVAFADTQPNRKTVAHELTHVVQFRNSTGLPSQDSGINRSSSSAEVEADTVAGIVAAGGCAGRVRAKPETALHRQDSEPPTSSTVEDSVSEGVESNQTTDTPLNYSPASGVSTDTSSVTETGASDTEQQAEVYNSVNEALNSGMRKVQQISTTLSFVRESLLPAYKSARDAVDVNAATELAAVVVQGVSNSRTTFVEAQNISVDFDPGAAVESALNQQFSIAEADELDYGLHADLVTELDLIAQDLENCELMLMTAMGPQEFRGTLVAGGLFRPGANDNLQAIIREASITIDILITANAMKERTLGVTSVLQYREIVTMAEMWQSRRMNFYFLYHVLSVLLGASFNLLRAFSGSSGRTLVQMRGDVQDNTRTFGVMTDVGSYSESMMSDLLTYSLGDWAITDENARSAFDMIASASPAARLPILQRLNERGLLTRLCNNLPGQYVQALLDDIGGARGANAPAVAFVLQDCISENTGGGETVSELYESNIMENLENDNYVRAYLWTLLDVAHSATSLGFKDIHDQAYQARREGLISSDEYWSITAKAAGRSAALLAATALTGGTAGGFAEGFALARGAGATTASLIGAGVGGGVAGFTGQLTGDIYDQALLGKEGFSSLGDYASATALGAGSGVLVGGVSMASARYLPGGAASAQRMFEYHSGSPAGRYRFAQGPRQALHGGLYSMYRNASFAGRNFGRRTGLPPEQYQEYFEFGSEDARHHTFEGDLGTNPNTGELQGRGGHLWPSNRAGGPSAAGGGPSGPKSAFPPGWNQERIMRVIADTYTDPVQPWVQQEGPGTNTVHAGLPEHIRTNAGNPVRFRTDIFVDGIEMRIVWQPGGRELITAYPLGSGAPANLLMTIPPYASFVEGESDAESR